MENSTEMENRGGRRGGYTGGGGGALKEKGEGMCVEGEME